MFFTISQRFYDFAQGAAVPFARFSLFVIYFWFGVLKLFDTSPANPLVAQLLERTMPFVTFDQFIIGLGLFEMLIGVLFLVSKFDKITIPLFAIHMITTAMPLILLPAVSWQAPFVPTLEGQYCIKNLALVGLVLCIAASHSQRRTTSYLP